MSRSNSRRALALVALVGGLALAAPTEAPAQAKKSDSVVKVSATADKVGADGKQVVTVTLMIDRDWHVYANPVGQTDLDDAKTTVQVIGKVKPASVKIDYPAGELVKDKVVGDYRVYHGKATIRATVQRARGDTSALEAVVRFQSCSKGRCLLPATVKVPVR
jgi:hypothetical protein